MRVVGETQFTPIAVREGDRRCCKQQLTLVPLPFLVHVSEQRVFIGEIPKNLAITAIAAMRVNTMKAGTRKNVRGGTS